MTDESLVVCSTHDFEIFEIFDRNKNETEQKRVSVNKNTSFPKVLQKNNIIIDVHETGKFSTLENYFL